MALVPDEHEVKRAQLETAEAISNKLSDQQALGKGFEVDPEGHSPGVIPEEVWQTFKEAV